MPDPVNQIILARHDDLAMTEPQYKARLNELVLHYKTIVQQRTADTNVIIRQIGWMDSDVRYLDPRLKEYWMEEGLVLWKRFIGTAGILENWCQFMNESLINSIYVSVFALGTSWREYKFDDSIGIRTETLGTLALTIDRFFINSTLDIAHPLSLCRFHALHVLNDSTAATFMEVPYDIHYDNQKEFVDLLTSEQIRQFQWTMIQHLCGIEYIRSIESLQGPLTAFDITKKTGQDLTAVGVPMMQHIIKGQGRFNTWCRVMVDEMINQMLIVINSVIYVNNLGIDTIQPRRRLPRMISTMQLEISSISDKFLTVNGRRSSALQNEYEWLNWSGKWGINALFSNNFVLVSPEEYNLLNSVNETNFYPLPGPSITMDQWLERADRIAHIKEGTSKFSGLPRDALDTILRYTIGHPSRSLRPFDGQL